MNTQRFDIYRLIHKGLRAYLSETLLTVGRMDFESDADLDAGLNSLTDLLDFCESHVHHENTFVHPAMQACSPGSADDMDAHHQQHLDMISELRSSAARLPTLAATDREGETAVLYRKLALFVADNLAHMHEEETRNNEILWRGYTDEEIMAIHDALVQSIPPDENAIAMRWMLSAFNHQERHRLLQGILMEAPRPAFEHTMDIARCTLPDADWNKLKMAVHC